MAQLCNVKCAICDDIRRLSVPSDVSLSNLHAIIRERFELHPDEDVSLTYQDEDGDTITIAHDHDLREAFRLAAGGLSLRFRVELIEPVVSPGERRPAVTDESLTYELVRLAQHIEESDVEPYPEEGDEASPKSQDEEQEAAEAIHASAHATEEAARQGDYPDSFLHAVDTLRNVISHAGCKELAEGQAAGMRLLTESMRRFILEHGVERSRLEAWVKLNEPSVQNGTRPLEMFMRPGANEGYHRAWKDALSQASAIEREGAERRADLSALAAMGFSEEKAAEALSASGGSLEEAVEWLCGEDGYVEVQGPPDFPSEWEPSAAELVEMGFGADPARWALQGSRGELKGAVRALVEAERAPAAAQAVPKPEARSFCGFRLGKKRSSPAGCTAAAAFR